MRAISSTALLFSVVATLVACHGSGGGTSAAQSVAPSYQTGSHARIPRAPYLRGELNTAPKVVTVTFAGDPYTPRLQLFGDTIGQSDWWSQATAGACENKAGCPCVGQAVGGGHVVLSDSLGSPDGGGTVTLGFNDVLALLQKHISDGTVPDPTTSTVYMFYLPNGAVVPFGGLPSSCDVRTGGIAWTAEHIPLTPKAGGAAVMTQVAVTMHCETEADTTKFASQGIITLAVNSDNGLPGFYNLDQNWGWHPSGFQEGDVSNLCEYRDFFAPNDAQGHIISTASVVDPAHNFTVYRVWNDQSLKAGKDPCVPIPSGDVYFNASFDAPHGFVRLPIGGKATVEVSAFSEAKTGDWTLSAVDYESKFNGNPPVLSFAFDKTKVNNGDKAHLTITLNKFPSVAYVTAAHFAIVSTNAAGRVNFWPGVVVPQ